MLEIQPDSTPRQRILDAAAAAFAADGFAGARVDRIALRAGVNKAMLYYHVGDKQALYTAVLQRNFERVQEALDAAIGRGGSARERLRSVIAALVEVVDRHPEHPRIVLREVASGAVQLSDDIVRKLLSVVETVRELLIEGVRAGEFRALDPLLTHLAIVGSLAFMTSLTPLLERAASLAPDGGFTRSDRDIADFLAALTLDGITATREGDP
jgi:AcrR family transcriptional regulator